MARRIFLSFRFHEKGLLNDLLRCFQEQGGPIQATPAFMTEDMGSDETRIEQAIRQQMKDCVAMLVLAGDDAHNSPWMIWEAGVANEMQIEKFGVRHPGAAGAFPKPHEGMREIAWSCAELARVLNALPDQPPPSAP